MSGRYYARIIAWLEQGKTKKLLVRKYWDSGGWKNEIEHAVLGRYCNKKPLIGQCGNNSSSFTNQSIHYRSCSRSGANNLAHLLGARLLLFHDLQAFMVSRSTFQRHEIEKETRCRVLDSGFVDSPSETSWKELSWEPDHSCPPRGRGLVQEWETECSWWWGFP